MSSIQVDALAVACAVSSAAQALGVPVYCPKNTRCVALCVSDSATISDVTKEMERFGDICNVDVTLRSAFKLATVSFFDSRSATVAVSEGYTPLSEAMAAAFAASSQVWIPNGVIESKKVLFEEVGLLKPEHVADIENDGLYSKVMYHDVRTKLRIQKIIREISTDDLSQPGSAKADVSRGSYLCEPKVAIGTVKDGRPSYKGSLLVPTTTPLVISRSTSGSDSEDEFHDSSESFFEGTDPSVDSISPSVAQVSLNSPVRAPPGFAPTSRDPPSKDSESKGILSSPPLATTRSGSLHSMPSQTGSQHSSLFPQPLLENNFYSMERSRTMSGDQSSRPSLMGSPQAPRGSFAQKASDYHVNIDAILKGTEARLTIALRNIPRRYSKGEVKVMLLKAGVSGITNFYLPIDNATGTNQGYAFISFESVMSVITVYTAFQGLEWDPVMRDPNQKPCNVVFAKNQKPVWLEKKGDEGSDGRTSFLSTPSSQSHNGSRPLLNSPSSSPSGPNSGDMDRYTPLMRGDRHSIAVPQKVTFDRQLTRQTTRSLADARKSLPVSTRVYVPQQNSENEADPRQAFLNTPTPKAQTNLDVSGLADTLAGASKGRFSVLENAF